MISEISKKIKISSVIDNLSPEGLPEGDPERTESISDGKYFFSDKGIKIVYEEKQNGEVITHKILSSMETVRVCASGAVSSDMIFSVDKPHKSLYSVGPYSFDMEVTAKKIRFDFCDEGGTLDLLYDMNVGGQNKRTRMKITVI